MEKMRKDAEAQRRKFRRAVQHRMQPPVEIRRHAEGEPTFREFGEDCGIAW